MLCCWVNAVSVLHTVNDLDGMKGKLKFGFTILPGLASERSLNAIILFI